VLLAGIIEKASSIPYYEFVRKHIFLPLEMNNTSCINNQNDLTTRGYYKTENGLEHVPFSYMTFSIGNGNLYSTMHDLVKWNESINSEKLSSDSVYQKWFSHHAEVEEESEYEDKGDYSGYGWFLSFQEDKVYKTYHLGGVTGYKTSITRFPNDNILVLTLSNLEDEYSNNLRMEFPKLVYQREAKRHSKSKKL
jgi:CubicO group peptidase (beta-lactamase class C family)